MLHLITCIVIVLVEIPFTYRLSISMVSDDEEIIIYVQDGRINYDEFAAMMRKGNPEAHTKKRRDSFVSQ